MKTIQLKGMMAAMLTAMCVTFRRKGSSLGVYSGGKPLYAN